MSRAETIRVAEQFVEGKQQDSNRCEDALYIGDQLYAVVDGATNTSVAYEDGISPGRLAADTLVKALGEMDTTLSARRAMRWLDGQILRWYREHDLERVVADDPFQRISASMVVFHAGRSEIWLLGDCQALIDSVHVTNHKAVDLLTEEVRAFMIESELARGATVETLLQHDAGRAAIDDLIRRQRVFQNQVRGTRYDYFVLDGFLPESFNMIIYPVPEGAESVVLASDGYPELYPTLAATEAALREVLHNDPLLFRRMKATKGVYPGSRSFDDRAYLRIQRSSAGRDALHP